MLLRGVCLLIVAAITVAGCAHRSADPDAWQASIKDGSHVAAEAAATNGKASDAAPEPGGHNLPWRAERDGQAIPASHVPRAPHAVAHEDGPYLLDTGDKLRLFVFDQPSLNRIYTVDHAGNIAVPLIGIVGARQRTVYQVSDVIRSRLAARFVRDPYVTVDIFENRPFFILGEVRSPGQYPYVNGMTLETAVAIAGGYSERADKNRFRVTRRIDGVAEVNETTPDFVLRPGDTITVAERFF